MRKKDKDKVSVILFITIVLMMIVVGSGAEYIINLFVLLIFIAFIFSFILRLIFRKKVVYYVPLVLTILFTLGMYIYGLSHSFDRSIFDESFLTVLFYISGLFLMASLTSYALGIIVEYIYFEKKQIICNKTVLKYKEIILLVIVAWSGIDEYFLMVDNWHDVSHLNIIIILLFFNVIYAGINLFIKYVLKLRKLDFAYIALFLMLFHFMLLPFGEINDYFDTFSGDYLTTIEMLNISFYSYIVFTLIKVIYFKRNEFISSPSEEMNENNNK